jgi:hypothetical protein
MVKWLKYKNLILELSIKGKIEVHSFFGII